MSGIRWRVASLILVLVAPGMVMAGIWKESQPWPYPGEMLIYSGCGCADSCWVAELRSKRTQALKARLRCDCEVVHFLKVGEKERVYAPSCKAFEGNDKFEVITRTMETLTH
ncbi:hypothetical protein [Dyella telluris]|uniref:Uncharacterized protein n=1 Tax=Dyella telluris TaxID=2763498 RepID=A0A7G8PZN6_9GAMM|nr:hypothetical protein [Dyella telluris]QNJ99993.1 hypothetical protein H8F01_12715 [Dyella telluris]